PLSWEARILTSSRSFGSKSTLSSSLVAARSRWAIARENPAACSSKSSLTSIVVVCGAVICVVMQPTLVGDRPSSNVYNGVTNLGQFASRSRAGWPALAGQLRNRPASGSGRVTGQGGPGGGPARRDADGQACSGTQAALLPGSGRRPGHRPQH